MVKDDVVLETKDSGLRLVIEALTKSIARLTENSELHTTTVPGLSLFQPIKPITACMNRTFAWSQACAARRFGVQVESNVNKKGQAIEMLGLLNFSGAGTEFNRLCN